MHCKKKGVKLQNGSDHNRYRQNHSKTILLGPDGVTIENFLYRHSKILLRTRLKNVRKKIVPLTKNIQKTEPFDIEGMEQLQHSMIGRILTKIKRGLASKVSGAPNLQR